MSKSSANSVIRLRGVRQNNLKNFDLDLPLHRLIVVTGLSGSGKSSLAFDTLFAEGQRRYIETFSPYARQFFDRMDRPQVDGIEGIPPAIAIEQRNAVRTTRSTVGTITEICDYMKLLWPHVAQLHCRGCGQPVRKDSPQQIWVALTSSSSSFSSSSSNRRAAEDEDEGRGRSKEVLVTFDLPLSEKLSLEDSLALIAKQGYQRLFLDGEIVRLEDISSRLVPRATHLTVVQDRLRLAGSSRARFVEACEQAYHFGKGKLAVHILQGTATAEPDVTIQRFNDLTLKFSNRRHCAACDIEYREPSPALFSFNHPVGACPTCKGFGRIISIDYDLALPDRSLTLAAGAVRPWRSGFSAECQDDLLKFCRARGVSVNVPFDKLRPEHQRWVIEGDEDYGSDDAHEWPHAWYGIKGYFRWLESKAYKMHVRVLLSRYRAYTTCPDCKGARLQPDALLYLLPVGADVRRLCSQIQNDPPPHVGSYNFLTLADFYALPIRDARAVMDHLADRVRTAREHTAPTAIEIVLDEVRSRLAYLNEVGLGYLTLDRPTRSLSGGETERVNLTTCLGTRLVNTLFVLDEPSVGLHPRDTDRLVHILQQLRDAGNTVVVVEHEAGVIRAADQIVDLGPGHGESGGRVVFQGPFRALLKDKQSLTGQYLSGRKEIKIPKRRIVQRAAGVSPAGSKRVNRDCRQDAGSTFLHLTNATRHNLKNLTVEIPLGRFVCITGVSGSGKTTLIREVLLPALQASLKSEIANLRSEPAKASDPLSGDDNADEDDKSEIRNPQSAILQCHEHLGCVVLVDQAILGKTPRSNPAVYIGAFDDIRELFAQSEAARQHGFGASAFSFNSAQGQCERCRGAGFEKIEMQFLSDVFIRCPDCNGRRYRQHVLEVKVESRGSRAESQTRRGKLSTLDARRSTGAWSIADVLDATADEVVEFLSGFGDSKPAQRAVAALRLLQDVGLGYLRLGQPINTLSGGESQRLKLVRHLAEFAVGADVRRLTSKSEIQNPKSETDQSLLTSAPTLFLFDEPTTGLHFDDIRTLLKVFQRLVDAGHSLIVIEHNLDVIKCADWVIDLGPDAGDEGGQVVAQGTPEDIAACPHSHTGRALRAILCRKQ